MGNLYKWSRDDNRDSDKIYVVLFTSRNKDNRDIDKRDEYHLLQLVNHLIYCRNLRHS